MRVKNAFFRKFTSDMEKYFLSFFLLFLYLACQTAAEEQQQQPNVKKKSKAISEKRHGCNVEIEN